MGMSIEAQLGETASAGGQLLAGLGPFARSTAWLLVAFVAERAENRAAQLKVTAAVRAEPHQVKLYQATGMA